MNALEAYRAETALGDAPLAIDVQVRGDEMRGKTSALWRLDSPGDIKRALSRDFGVFRAA